MSNKLTLQIEKYIKYKQGLGFKIKIESEELRRFAAYTRTINYDGSLSKAIVFDWISHKSNISRWYMARKFETVRTFSKYIVFIDTSAELLPKGAFGKCHGKTIPYIYDNDSINQLLMASLKLKSTNELRAKTVTTAIGLMWVTGIRPNEACNLRDHDIDFDQNRIMIRATKFSKERILPLHASTIQSLKKYVCERNTLRASCLESFFFILSDGKSLTLRKFEYAFSVIRDVLLPPQSKWNRRPPRLYDIRHSFACNTILDWLNSDENVNNKIIYLSTYLGHAKVKDTYWYLTGTPELLALVSYNFEVYFTSNFGEKNEKA